MALKLPWAQKPMFWAFEKGIFQIFADFWVTKLKPFSEKVRQSVQDYLNQMVIESFLENGFEPTLSSKTNVASVWKGYFSVFCRFLSDELQPFSGKVGQLVQSYLNQNLVIWSFLENSFGVIFSSKMNVLNVLKSAFFSFVQIFEWRSWNHFLGKWGNTAKTISLKSTLLRAF